MSRPEPSEYNTYYGRYISLVPDGPIVARLREQIVETLAVLRALPESRGEHRYAPGKWSIKEIVGHVCDAERVFGYRALRIGRGDETPLPGFEQDDYVRNGGFSSRTLRHLLDELEAVRRGTVLLLEGLDETAMKRHGTASGFPVSVRALAYITAGHELHHLKVLRERYLT
ncbi:MAG TPA: DinB family protein [Candidatus Eisenbacteria bacterium]|nr:DinB family protein [Candidatus Eisenbacteria bacterium]